MKLMQLTLAAWLLIASTASATELHVGDVAPAFNLQGSDGHSHTLEEFHNKQYVVIAFFPKAHTGG
ncbi:MAG: peroxiredoxin Q/BCP [Candidatus Azotimanducaceae bacterium]|jgi:peroxiredoxin Q/BCP